MILAAKCAPDKSILANIAKAGLEAAELYLSKTILKETPRIIEMCKEFPLRYAIHAPIDGQALQETAACAQAINAEAVVFHNIYWEDEWEGIVQLFRDKTDAKLCIENTLSANEIFKFVRRYGMGICLDFEHLQLECAGLWEEHLPSLVSRTSHIHLTGYTYGSTLWHTPIHHSPKTNELLFDLIQKTGYTGFIVSEAGVKHQTYEEFKGLNDFFKTWRDNTVCYEA